MHIIVIVVNDIIVILKHISKLGTRKRLLNTEIESSYENSKNLNVDEVTILEPFDNIYHKIVSVMKQSTQEYYNMRMILGLKCA